jgi:hypothetical protein
VKPDGVKARSSSPHRRTPNPSTFYAEQDRVRLFTCEEDVGHIWISSATVYWADIPANSPKGTTAPLDPGSPPGELECSTAPPG